MGTSSGHGAIRRRAHCAGAGTRRHGAPLNGSCAQRARPRHSPASRRSTSANCGDRASPDGPGVRAASCAAWPAGPMVVRPRPRPRVPCMSPVPVVTKWGGRPHRRIVAAVLARDYDPALGYTPCLHCGRPATSADHWPVARVEGAPDTVDACVSSCLPCNLQRGAELGRLRRLPPAPSRQW